MDEKSDTFISYINNYRYDLNDGMEILWMSERDGWRHLYRIDGKTGEVKNQITRGEWVVRKVILWMPVSRGYTLWLRGLIRKKILITSIIVV